MLLKLAETLMSILLGKSCSQRDVSLKAYCNKNHLRVEVLGEKIYKGSGFIFAKQAIKYKFGAERQ